MFRKSRIIAGLKRQIEENAENQLRQVGQSDYLQLLRNLITESNLQEISPRRFKGMSAYTPRQLGGFLKLVLQLPPDLAAVLCHRILPMHASSLSLPITIGGDFSMTLERAYLVAPEFGDKAAMILARCVLLGTHFGLTWFVRGTVSRIGKFGLPGAEGDFMVPEPQMAGRVVAEIGNLAPELRNLFT